MKTTLCIPTHAITNELLTTVNNYFLAFNEESEIVIVLDGGTRGPLLDAFNFLGEACKVICLEKSHGPAFARNLAAKTATGEVLVIVDSDVIVHPPVFKRLAEVLSAEVLVPAVLPLALNSKPSRFFSDFAHAPKQKDGLLLTVSACFSLRKQDYLKQGGFNENYKHPAGEDWEFFSRIQKNGLSITYDNSFRVFHKNPTSFVGVLSRSYRYARYGAEIQQSFPKNQAPSSEEPICSKRVWFYLPGIVVLGGAKIISSSLSIGKDSFERFCIWLQIQQEKQHKKILQVAYGSKKKASKARLSSNKVVHLSNSMANFSMASPWESIVDVRNDLSTRERKSYRLLVLGWQLTYIVGYMLRAKALARQ